ncbi:MAG TPA: hypothetical protein VK846_11355 [Candidatus Limnocylindria bacterium]|nr:hypothetical protein [Candidatus Limnocylindria bacterium]
MKTEIVPRLTRSLMLVTLCLAACDTWARSPQARELCGVLQNINGEARPLTLAAEKKERPLAVIWKNDTKFLKN